MNEPQPIRGADADYSLSVEFNGWQAAGARPAEASGRKFVRV